MTLRQLLARARIRLDDTVPTYLWSDEELVGHIDSAVKETAERGKLLEDDTTAEICDIDGEADIAVYDLDPRIIEVRTVTWDGKFLTGVAQATLNANPERSIYGSNTGFLNDINNRDWRLLSGSPVKFIDAQRKTLTLVPKPTTAKAIHLSVFRLPLVDLTLANLDAEPEINAKWHEDTLWWVEYLAYQKRDTETYNPNLAAEKAATFNAKFGDKPDANVDRKQRERRTNQVRMNPDW